MDAEWETMPLTKLQAEIGRLLAKNRSEDSYLAGGAAILSAPETKRFSQDLDYFHDSENRVASAFEADRMTLSEAGYSLQVELSQKGYIRTVVGNGIDSTKVEWAQDSSWRFMPVLLSLEFGYQLHPIDLATNKILALGGREESRDLIDTLYFHEHLLPLGPLVWASAGKDPGFSPSSLLELLRRRGKIRQEDINRLNLTENLDPTEIKKSWLAALEGCENFIRSRPIEEAGCLFYSPRLNRFIDPSSEREKDFILHFGKPGGVLPRIVE